MNSPWKHVAGSVFERSWEFEYGDPMNVSIEKWEELRYDPYFRVGMGDMEPGQLGTYIDTEKKIGHRVFLQHKSVD